MNFEKNNLDQIFKGFQSPIKVTATIGPSSKETATLKEMMKEGMTIARLNFSHGNQEFHGKLIQSLKQAQKEVGKRIGIMLDLKGPKIRTGLLKEGKPVSLVEGNTFTLTIDESFIGSAEKVGISHKLLPNEVKKGDKIFLDDGSIKLIVTDVKKDEVVTKIMNSGILSEHKGVNVPGVHINMSIVTDKDKNDLKFGIGLDVDFVSVSFVQKAADISYIRKLADEFAKGKAKVKLIAKIECQAGVDNFDSILEEVDGIMVARGDLGIEVPVERVISLQKELVRKCIAKNKPVIVATQMLESMIKNPSPTRAEVADVYNSVLDGTDCVMLSAESANGSYPIEAVKYHRLITNVAISDIPHAMESKIMFDFTEHAEKKTIETDYSNLVALLGKKKSMVFIVTKSEKLVAWTNLFRNCFGIFVESEVQKSEVFKYLKEKGVILAKLI